MPTHAKRRIAARHRPRGFTLIEVLIVLGIIAVLAAVVLVALNPAREFAQARNTQRVSNVTSILNAIDQRIIDNRGTFSGGFTIGDASYICPTINPGEEPLLIASQRAGSYADLSCLVPTYLPSGLPADPSAPDAEWKDAEHYNTGYYISRDSHGRYTIAAKSAELDETISVTR